MHGNSFFNENLNNSRKIHKDTEDHYLNHQTRIILMDSLYKVLVIAN